MSSPRKYRTPFCDAARKCLLSGDKTTRSPAFVAFSIKGLLGDSPKQNRKSPHTYILVGSTKKIRRGALLYEYCARAYQVQYTLSENPRVRATEV